MDEYLDLIRNGQVMIIEMRVMTLDDPRDLIMRKLQQFSGISSSRTFFGVHFAKEETVDKGWSMKNALEGLRKSAAPILNWKRIFGG
jgi:hypothetical protein